MTRRSRPSPVRAAAADAADSLHDRVDLGDLAPATLVA